MVVPARGAVVLVRFPFSDLSHAKLRPAVVLASAEHNDWVLCQVTSNPFGDSGAVRITPDDFVAGSLRLVSFVRPGKLFTADGSLMVTQAGMLNAEARNRVIEAVVTLLRSDGR